MTVNPFIGNPKTLLLHQLINSDLFGMTSDQSVEMEKKKKRFEKLTTQKKLTATQKKEHKKLEEDLSTNPSLVRSNMELSTDQMDLLKRIHRELEGGSK